MSGMARVLCVVAVDKSVEVCKLVTSLYKQFPSAFGTAFPFKFDDAIEIFTELVAHDGINEFYELLMV